ncbi:hypothetical protein FLL45_14735 [Aliikangiella marina]|uniref:DUF1311 domain-containing protein n=1 Tax=Aliikangiella marina TaxID=1712262 RepID=A0A545TA68_9GAMM|nr:hypothetical protein [Aliikangiella marina]TQV74110.1 hypothetical protein FLL45_14735 [Aliikangiella marina]
MNKHLLIVLIMLTSSGVSYSSNVLKDPTIQRGDFTTEERDKIIQQVNSLGTKESVCVRQFYRSYQKSLFDYCEANGNGSSVGGDCEHIAYAWSLHSAVTVQAFRHCDIELNQSLKKDDKSKSAS